MKYVKLFESWINESEMDLVNKFIDKTLKGIAEIEKANPLLKGLSAETKKLRSEYTSKHPDYKSPESILEYTEKLAKIATKYVDVVKTGSRQGQTSAEAEVSASENKEQLGKELTQKIAQSTVLLEGLSILMCKTADYVEYSEKKNIDIKGIDEIEQKDLDIVKIYKFKVIPAAESLNKKKGTEMISALEDAISAVKGDLYGYGEDASTLQGLNPSVFTKVMASIF